MLFTLSSKKTIREVSDSLESAAKESGFGVMQIHNLKETMKKKGVDFPRECLIFEICQPNQAKSVLEKNMSISTVLPCRISVYEEEGKTVLATLRPTGLLGLFHENQLIAIAEEIEQAILRMMKLAAET